MKKGEGVLETGELNKNALPVCHMRMPWSFMINYGFSVEKISPTTIIIERLFVPVKQLQGIGNGTVTSSSLL
jgi:hypothetical protein